LYQVPAAGGTPKVVATVDPSRGEIAYLFPHFLPDGRHFLYSVMNREPGEAAVRASSLDGGNSKFLLNADLGAAYAGHTGSLIFAYHGALMSQPFDVQRLQLTGAASQIAPVVRHLAMRADFSASSNGVIAYQGNSEKDRQLTWFDRKGKELGTAGPRNNYRSFSLSPDEKRLAIEADDPASGRAELWIMDLQRGSMSRIGAQALGGLAPVWSPDGSEIAFSAITASGMYLWRQAADQLDAAPLLELAGPKTASDWSADGKFLAYTAAWPEFQSLGIWVMPARGSGKDKGHAYSTGPFECCAVFSPSLSADGPRWMAYSSNATGQEEVYVKGLPAGDRQWQVSTGGGRLPHWRQDGRELFYLAPDTKLMAVDIPTGANFAAGTPRALFETTIVPFSYPTLPGNSYAVSRDGQRFLVNYAIRKTAPESITVVLPSR
jgi:Tol biopolymer transport system component